MTPGPKQPERVSNRPDFTPTGVPLPVRAVLPGLPTGGQAASGTRMGVPDTHHNERRRFFGTLLRGGALVALGALGAKLVARNLSGPLNPDEKCTNRGLCRGCRSLDGCPSLQAELFRQGEEEP
jgi:hypothetical protein